MKNQPRIDIYERITNQIVAAIEKGAGAFEMPWHSPTASGLMPINFTTGKRYRGINTVALWVASQEAGFASNEWGTYRQWSDQGAQVRKGEKSTMIVYWGEYRADQAEAVTEANGDTLASDDQKRMFAKAYPVFNAAQVDGYTPKNPAIVVEPCPPGERIPEADAFFDHSGATVQHGGHQAFYAPGRDLIQMPHFEHFKSVEGYYSTFAHESSHWTAPRLERSLKGRFGDQSYAMEELVAELGAAFTMSNLGLANNEPRADHAQYIQSWLSVLKNDKRAIFTASSHAQRAADFLMQQQPQPMAEYTPEFDEEAPAHTPATPHPTMGL